MINIPPIKQTTPIKVDLIPQLTRTWRVGQVLNATAQRGGEALSKVLIQVGQYTLEAKTPIALQTGQEIKLLVKSLNEFQQNNPIIKLPLLSIIKPSNPPSNNQLGVVKLRQFIAIQQSFNQLQQITSHTLGNKMAVENLPVSLKNLLTELQKNISITPSTINSTEIKQRLFNSGLFLESKLHTFKTENISTDKIGQKIETSLNRDFKFQLLNIKSELDKLLPTKNQSDTQALNKQQLQQIESLLKQATGNSSTNPLNALSDKLSTLLSKDSLSQLTTLMRGQNLSIPINREMQLLVDLLTQTIQKNSQISINQLQEKIQFRLLLLDLSQQIDQSISKITSLQLQPMSREGDNLILLLFNLVFKDRHEQFDINIKLQQDDKKNDTSEENWSVILTFNFKTLGKVQSKINLNGENISNTFYTELASTAEKIQQLLPLLNTSLVKAGLNIINLSVKNCLIDDTSNINNRVNLLDENA